MFPDGKSRIQIFLHCSGGCYREESAGQAPRGNALFSWGHAGQNQEARVCGES